MKSRVDKAFDRRSKDDKMKTVKDYVKDDKKAYFKFYRQNVLYYETEDGTLLFEVPTYDLGDACANTEEKAIMFMKWIRKQLDANKQGRKECATLADLGFADISIEQAKEAGQEAGAAVGRI